MRKKNKRIYQNDCLNTSITVYFDNFNKIKYIPMTLTAIEVMNTLRNVSKGNTKTRGISDISAVLDCNK